MKLENLSLSNFMGWASFEVDLSQYSGIVAILGSIEADMAHSNGTGKSSLIAGINYSLYGTSVSKNLDGMIHQVGGVPAEDGYKTELRFSHAGKQYKVVRKKKFGSAQKTVFTNITDDQPMSVSVEEFLGMPEVVWQNTIYSAQRNLSAFVDKLPSVRKDILTEIFGMNSYLELEKKARQLSATSEVELSLVNDTLERLRAELLTFTVTQADIDALAAEIVSKEAAIAQLNTEATAAAVEISQLNQSCADYDRLSVELQRDERALNSLIAHHSDTTARWENKLARYDATIEQYEADTAVAPDDKVATVLNIQIQNAELTRPALEDLKKQQDDIVQQMATAKAEADQAEKTIWEYKGQVDDLPKDKCPLCGTNMTEEHLGKHRGELQAKVEAAGFLCAERKQTINNLSINLLNIRGELARITAILNTIPELTRKLSAEARAKENYVANVAHLKSLKEERELETAGHITDAAELVSNIVKAKTEVISKRGSMPDVGDVLMKKSKLQDRKYQLDRIIVGMHPELDALRHRRSLAVYQLEQHAKKTEELPLKEAGVKSAALKRNVHLELVKAFGPTGIPTLVLENCLTELQQYLDQYMELLSDGKIHVTFQTIKTNATTAKTSETLAIMVADINGERDISLYSGGETVRIYLAIRLALAKLLYLKSGQKLGLLIIDEIADLDDAGLLAFVELLKRIEPEFEQILLVSHLPELKSSFENALVLSRDLEGNYIPAA
jgi:DNA repair exonuclease SbcCD ATPase subunit